MIRYQVQWVRSWPGYVSVLVLSPPRKSCFGIDVYLGSYKKLGSNLGKLSEV